MGLWKRIEQKLWTGPVLAEYPVSEGQYGIGKRRVSLLHARRGDTDKVVIRVSYKAFLGASVQFVDLDRDSAGRLHAALGEALGRMR